MYGMAMCGGSKNMEKNKDELRWYKEIKKRWMDSLENKKHKRGELLSYFLDECCDEIMTMIWLSGHCGGGGKQTENHGF